ncbi:MAG: cell wall hydrolase [Sphingobium sp.]
MRGNTGLTGQRKDVATRWYGGVIGLAMLAGVALQLLPSASLGALDVLNEPASYDLGESAGDNFPGSAFFYAQGAFSPLSARDSAHVTALGESSPALAVPFRGVTAVDRYRATNCLTSAIYYEAGNEPDDGQRAVAQVVLNRVRHPAWPHSVCGVVYQGSERADTRCQFTFSCDGAMTRMPNNASWGRAQRVAMQALAGAVYAPVGLATHYHTLAVHPNWANSLTPVAVIGAHIFYRWQGTNGTARAFSALYTGRELQGGPSLRLEVYRAPGAPLIAPIISAQTPEIPKWPILPSAMSPSADLPQSTIRPEFRNSGRPLSP